MTERQHQEVIWTDYRSGVQFNDQADQMVISVKFNSSVAHRNK